MLAQFWALRVHTYIAPSLSKKLARYQFASEKNLKSISSCMYVEEFSLTFELQQEDHARIVQLFIGL